MINDVGGSDDRDGFFALSEEFVGPSGPGRRACPHGTPEFLRHQRIHQWIATS
jgi:hypothetical protein